MFDKIKDIVSDITGGKDLGELDLGGIEKYVEGITFPISKQELKTALENNGVPDKFLGLVDQLPDKVFESSEDAVNSLAAVAGIAGLDQAADKAGAAADAASDAADPGAGCRRRRQEDLEEFAVAAVVRTRNEGRGRPGDHGPYSR